MGRGLRVGGGRGHKRIKICKCSLLSTMSVIITYYKHVVKKRSGNGGREYRTREEGENNTNEKNMC